MTFLLTIFSALCVSAEATAPTPPTPVSIKIASAIVDDQGTLTLTAVDGQDCWTRSEVETPVTVTHRDGTTETHAEMRIMTTPHPFAKLMRVVIPPLLGREFRLFRNEKLLDKQMGCALLKQPRRVVVVEGANSDAALTSKVLSLFVSDVIVVSAKSPFGWQYVQPWPDPPGAPLRPVGQAQPVPSSFEPPLDALTADFLRMPAKIKIADACMDSLGTLSLTTASLKFVFLGPFTSPAQAGESAPQGIPPPRWLPVTDSYRRVIPATNSRSFKVWRNQLLLDNQEANKLLKHTHNVVVVEGIDADGPLKSKVLPLFAPDVIVVGAGFICPETERRGRVDGDLWEYVESRENWHAVTGESMPPAASQPPVPKVIYPPLAPNWKNGPAAPAGR